MWPMVPVTTTAAVWGWYFLLLAILIGAPMLISGIGYHVSFKKTLERKMKEVDDEVARSLGKS